MVRKPFYWDKTVHGIFDGADAGPAIPALPQTVLTELRGRIAENAHPPSPEAQALIASAIRRAETLRDTGAASRPHAQDGQPIQVIGQIG